MVTATMEAPIDVEEWLSRDSCNNFCQRRREQFQRDVEALELVRDELLRSQKETIVQGLCKLNKDVKSLTVREFNATFGCDVIAMFREHFAAAQADDDEDDVVEGGLSNSSSSSNNSQSGMKRSRIVENLKTPAPDRWAKPPPPMTIRTVRRGEVVKSFSVNGSPVEQIDRGEVFLTAKKRRGEGRVNFANDSSIASIPEISIGIGVGNGETIDLSDPNQRKNLNREQKTFAMQQLMAIQEQMNKLMADF